jgi:hypothetical protein
MIVPAFLAVLLSAAAIVSAVRVGLQPVRAIYVGPLFLMAANVFLPAHARFLDYGQTSQWEMYFWAAGILLITLAAVPKLGLRPFFRAPRPLLAFLLAAVAASVYGYLLGNDPSYVLRQLYGSGLFFVYFVFAREYPDQALFMRRTRTYGTLLAVCFLAYYVAVFHEYGIHKEITSVGIQGAIFAILLAAEGGARSWSLAGLLFLIPLLLVWRHVIVAVPLALVVLWAMTANSRLRRWACAGLAAGLLAASLVPSVVASILDTALDNATVGRILPEGARDSSSIEDRGIELVEAGFIAQESPVLGRGMGSSLEWNSVTRGDWEQAYIDNGWAYLLTKMGLAGLLAFLWFAGALVRRINTASPGPAACLLTLLFFVMWSEPVFFQFTTAPFAGVVAGFVWAGKREARQLLPVQRSHTNPPRKPPVADASC